MLVGKVGFQEWFTGWVEREAMGREVAEVKNIVWQSQDGLSVDVAPATLGVYESWLDALFLVLKKCREKLPRD